VLLSLDLVDNSGRTEIYVGQGYMPRLSILTCAIQWNAADTSVLIAATMNRVYYIVVYGPLCRPAAPDSS